MQDRYVGDIGDFAKFGLLRYILSDLPQLKLGVQWYKVPDEIHNNDGRNIDYLASGNKFRDCDHDLYHALAAMVIAGERTLSAVQKKGILSPNTLYFETPLTYEGVPSARRPEYRREWLKCANDALRNADVIFTDPDNGLEVKGIDRHDLKGPKFTFYDDLIPFAQSGKSLIIYQHATRQGAFTDQIQRRLDVLRFKLDPHITQFAVVRFRRVSARAFIFAMAKAHATALQDRIDAFVKGPWGKHFTQQNEHLCNDRFVIESQRAI
jgi:hypothetical protein